MSAATDRNDPVLVDLSAALNLLVLEPTAGAGPVPRDYRVVGRPPAWAGAFLPAPVAVIQPGEVFPFLESFLPEAGAHWAAMAAGVGPAQPSDRLRSEVWTEVDSAGTEYHLGASAMCVTGRPLLVIVRAEEEFSQLHNTLQRARDNLLRHGREMSQVERERARLAVERERAVAASENKSRFLSQMGHELRSPLTAILGYAELLKEEAETAGDATATADLKRIQAAGRHLIALIGEVLDLSKAEAGRLSLDLETFNVAGMLDDVLATVTPLAGRNGNTIKLEVAPGVGAMRADRLRLSQCLVNLLSNAAKFTRRGTITVSATRETGSCGDWSVFAVTDTGIGMNAEQISRLFQPFAHADRGTQREYGGTGLGLSITRQLCLLMGGDVTACSDPGKGAVFTIRIPTEVKEPTGFAP